MMRYSGICTLIAGVSCFSLGSAACGSERDIGDPVTTVSDDESLLAASAPGEPPALTDPDSEDREQHSTLPIPPEDNIPRPSGRPENLRVLDWAGFRGAVSYTFDDSQPSQIES